MVAHFVHFFSTSLSPDETILVIFQRLFHGDRSVSQLRVAYPLAQPLCRKLSCRTSQPGQKSRIIMPSQFSNRQLVCHPQMLRDRFRKTGLKLLYVLHPPELFQGVPTKPA